MPKNPKITALTDALAKTFNPGSAGFNMSLAIGVCVTCPENAYNFRDELSEREYEISGMCQKCQDKTFGTGEEGDLPF